MTMGSGDVSWVEGRTTVGLRAAGEFSVKIAQVGRGRPVLVLHGGGGQPTVTGFAQLLAHEHPVRLYVPTHPGFGGEQAHPALSGIAELALLYVALLDELDLTGVTVIGSSIGGWIAAEMMLLESPRIESAVLIDAVGAQVANHPVVDFFSLTFPEIAEHSYFEPEKFRIDPSVLTEQQRTILGSNRAALQAYVGAGMEDPTLLARLSSVSVPTRVIWGAADRIADPDYGRALAGAIPGADFVVLPRTGHLPQIETPAQVVDTVWEFIDLHASLQGEKS